LSWDKVMADRYDERWPSTIKKKIKIWSMDGHFPIMTVN
jgi:hypothetical protein